MKDYVEKSRDYLEKGKDQMFDFADKSRDLLEQGTGQMKDLAKQGKGQMKDYAKQAKAGAKEGVSEIKNCCFKKKEEQHRNLCMALLPIILTIVTWPFVGVFKAFLWHENYPYPLTVCMMVHGVIFVLGTIWYIKQTYRRGCKMCAGSTRPKRKIREEGDLSESDEETDPAIAKKTPMTPYRCCLRYLHWGFFPGLFLDIFVYSAVVAEPMCRNNPNFCTVLFRSSLFLAGLIFLAIVAAPRRGERLDWLMAVLLFFGVSSFLWNSSRGFTISFSEDAQIAICGILALIAFGAYPMMLRKATLNSGVMKVLYIQSTWGFVFMLFLALIFEGSAPWKAAYVVGEGLSINYLLMGKITVIVLMCVVWAWAIVSAVSFTETIVVSLSLHFALFLGDFGVHSYIGSGYTFNVASIIGLILVGLPFLWLLKRLITVNCPDSCGQCCNCAWCPDFGQREEGATLMSDVRLSDDNELLDLDDGTSLSKGGSKYGATSYGSTDQSAYAGGDDEPRKKKGKKKRANK